MLSVSNLETRYGQVAALRGVSLEVQEGEIVCLIGPNGAGKTTTLMTISGLLKPVKGTIQLLSQDITLLSPERIVGLGIIQVPEGRWILGEMTVHENLLMGAYIRRDGKERIRTDIERVCELFPRLRERAQQRAGTLSGGEQQMLAIARALMASPKVLLMDEPSLGLAPFLVEEIFLAIQHLNANGTTILLVEQNARQALNISHRAYVLEVGRIVLEGPSRGLIENEMIRRSYLGVGSTGQRVNG
ncbi:MAG: ABC transporter ATP-binding protein [Nitrospinae bacterium]|nr:ABC transporter ATP-binding protein [Nitrospinota bacterium]